MTLFKINITTKIYEIKLYCVYPFNVDMICQLTVKHLSFQHEISSDERKFATLHVDIS